MNISTFDGPDELLGFADRCGSALFSAGKHEFHFPTRCTVETWPTDEIKELNKTLLDNLKNAANVYAIFLNDPTENGEWVAMYVGQRKASGLRERITQHLITRSQQTGSVLDLVKVAVSTGSKICLSFVNVRPDALRLYVEEVIIANHKQELKWNKHG
jgi:hypothetical protein